MNACLTGYYSGMGQATCTSCNAGDQCVGTESIACPTNKWSDYQSGICKWFLAGEYYPATYPSLTGAAVRPTCASGQYSRFGAAQCVDCPIGYYCPSPS